MPNDADGQTDLANLEVSLLKRLCADSACPTVYLTNRGTVVIQGYPVPARAAGIELPPEELLVEIPTDLLSAAAREIG